MNYTLYLRKEVLFSELIPGEYFEFGDNVYLKIVTLNVNLEETSYTLNSVNLATNSIDIFQNNHKVWKLKETTPIELTYA